MADPTFPRVIIHRAVVASTSDLARELVREGTVALPLVVRADRQTRGRGRGSHSWFSDAASLTFTLALDPAAHGLRAEHEPRLALAAAVVAIGAIGRLAPGAPLGIRWPNDIEAGDRKLGGLLPERVETARGPRLLLGLGLNVATRLDDAPPVVRSMATSIERLRGAPLPGDAVDALLLDLLPRLAAAVAALAADDPGQAEAWARLDTLRGRPVRIDLGPRVVAGVGAGIDARGGLRLLTDSGTVTLFGGQVLRER